MARGTTLGELVTQLRSEIGESINAGVALETNARYRQFIKRTQDQLFDEWDWPHLRVYRDITTLPGQRYYDFPTDILPESIQKVEYYWSGAYWTIDYGIGSNEYDSQESKSTQATAYFDITAGSAGTISSVKVDGLEILVSAVSWTTSNAVTAGLIATQINSVVSYPSYTAAANGNRVTLTASLAAGSTANNLTTVVSVTGDVVASTPTAFANGTTSQRSDPAERWAIFDNSYVPQVELWPVPASSAVLRLWGTRKLRPLVADSDVADLDDTLIVLSAAAELTAGKPISDFKLRKAQARMASLRARLSKKQPFVIGESATDSPRPREVIVKVSGT